MPITPENETYVAPEVATPALLAERPTLKTTAIYRSHSSWRGRIRAMLAFDGITLRCLRVVRFTLMLGPWRRPAIALLRYTFRNRVSSRVSPTMFPGLDVDAASLALDRDGFAVGLQLPPSSIKKIREFAAAGVLIEEAHWDCAEINRIARDAAIVEVVKRYLGVEPILYGTTLFWTLPGKSTKSNYPETFHYDVIDIKSVCVCFYLTDVFPDSAAHVAIAGTHKSKSLERLINPLITDEEAAQRFGSRVTTFTGKAGMGFFEDIAAQHKRLGCSKPRLVLFINYTLVRKPDTVRRNHKAHQ
jgi:hypothetical protein